MNLRLGSLLSIAVTIGVVAGATGLIIYDAVHLLLGLHDND